MTGAAVELGSDGLPRAPRVFRGKAVDTDPMNGDEIAARARAVVEAIEQARAQEEAAFKAAERAEVEAARERAKAWTNATPEQRAEIRRQRTRTTPMGPIARPAAETPPPPEMLPPAASASPATRQQTEEEREKLERERLERERTNEEARARAMAQANAMARQHMGLPPQDEPRTPGAPVNGDPLPRARAALAPAAKPARIGDTDPSRVEPIDGKSESASREAVSVKIVPGAPAESGGPPPTERLSDAEAAARSTAELQAHLKNGSAASRRTSTTPMADAPGRSVAPAAATSTKGATVPFGPRLTLPPEREPLRPQPAPPVPAADKEWSDAHWLLFVTGGLAVIALVTWIVVSAVMASRAAPPHLDVGAAPMVTAPLPAPPTPSTEPTPPSSSPSPSEAVMSPPPVAPAASSAKPGPQKLATPAAPRSMPSAGPGPKRVPRGESPKVGM